MTDFSASEYFRRKLDSLNVPKQDSIAQAVKNKVAGLQEYQQAVAEGRAFLEPDRTVLGTLGDLGVVAAKGVVALPEALVGLANIPTGGQVGKTLEESGIRFKEAKQFLDGLYSPAQQEANRRVDIADGFMETLEQAIDNPSTIATSVGESIPQMLGGAAAARGLLKIGSKVVGAGLQGPALPGVLARIAGPAAPVIAGAVGEGVIGAGAAAEQIRQQTEDGLLTGEQSLAAVGSGAGTALFSLLGARIAQKLGLPDIDTALAAGSLKSPAKFVQALIGSGISEGALEEMPQSAQEQMWQNYALDKPLFEGVGDAAAMGLLTGVAMGSGAGSASGLAGLSVQAAEAAATEAAGQKAKDAAQEAAIASGDVSALVDPKKSTYDPAQAVSALAGHSALPEITEEARQANLVKAGEIVAELEEQAKGALATYQEASPEGIADLKAKLAEAEAAGADEYVAALRLSLKDAEEATPAKVRSLKVQADRFAASLVQAKENLARFTSEVAGVEQGTEVDGLVASINTPIDDTNATAVQARSQAVDKVINLSMAAPETLSPKVAADLAANTKNGLSESQRTYLREFSAARVAENKAKSMDGVQEEVLVGGKGYVGLAQHREEITSAMASKNVKRTDRLIERLEAFALDHQAKAAIAMEAWEEGRGTQIVKTSAGWAIHRGPRLSDQAIQNNGGLTLNTEKLPAAIEAAATAITSALKELKAARALKFNTTKGEKVDVKDVPQAHNAAKDAGVGKQEVQAGAVAQEAAPARAGASVPRAGTQSTSVESTGVAEKTEAKQSTESVASRAEGQTQSTDSVSQSNESAELSNPSESSEKTSEDQSTESEAVEAGRLSLFEAKEEDNPIATGFVQEAARESDSTKRPLVAVKDFIGSLKERAQEFVTDRLDDSQTKALATFVQAAKAWAETIKVNLPARKAAQFRFEDVMQYLLNEAGDVDENVKTAISYAAFTWAADQASAPVNQDKKAVNKILGLQKDAWAGYEAYDLLGPAGTYHHLLMDSLGGTVMDALGLRDLPNTPQDQVSELRAALGGHALKLLEDRGMVKRTTIGADVIARLRKQETVKADIAYKDKTGKPVYVPHYFIAVARDEEGKPVKAVEAAHQATKGSKGVLEKLFKVTPHARAPSLVPITTLPETTKGTQMKVPEELKAVLLANQARPRKVRKDTVSLLGEFSEEAIHSLIGVVPEEDSSTHLVNRRGIEAKNAGLKREYSQFIDWIGEYLGTSKDGLDTPFYYEFMPWKQQRVGIATTIGNPQTSKIARFMVASPEWTTEIDSTDERLMTSFWLRVGEGLGVKTERADNEVSVTAITSMLAEPVYAAAIQALRKGKKLSTEEQEAVVAGVAKGGANLHTLDVLMGVAQQQNAEAAADGNPYTFTVQMMGEVDGVANGTMLNHVLMGAGNSAEELQGMLNAGGFYEIGSEHTQYNQWRGAPGNLDIYETTARWLDEQVRADYPLRRAGNLAAPLVDSIWAIAGEVFDASKGTVTKDGRNLVKDALNPLAFGSSMNAVVRGMSEAFLANVYKKFEKLSNEGADQAQVDALVEHMNRLLEGKKVKPLPLGRSIQEWMNTPLSSAVEAGLMKAFADTVGKSTVKVVEQRFAPFLTRRDALNKTANVAFGLSDAIYRGMRESYIEELIAAGKIKLDAKGNRTGDLTKKQEAELKRRMRFVDPVIQTAMSGKDRASGLRMAKVKRKQNKAPEYANKTQFGTQIGNLLAGNGKPMKSIVVHGFSSQQEEPGVAMGSATTHALDSAISHRTQAELDVLNVHDAVGAGVGGLEAAARLMNQNTWKAVLEYSPLEAAYQSLATVVRGLARMQEKGELSPQAVAYVQEFLEEQAAKAETNPAGLIEAWMADAKTMAYRADLVKLQVLSNLASVDQYAYQGGNYEVTDADRAQAEKLAAALTKELPEKDLAAVKALANIMDAKPEAAQATPVAQAAEGESVEAVVDGNTEEEGELDLDMDLPPMETSAPKSSQFGNLGTPATVDAGLVAFFKASPNPSMKDVLLQLSKSIKAKGDGRINAFQLELVQQIYKSIPSNVKVRLITPETKPGDVMAMPKGVVRGWFVAEKGKAEVYVLSQDFLYSGLNSTETLLHELVHATVGLIADNPDSESAPLVAELEALLEKARQHPNAAKHQEALVNVQELIAWGMTNAEFQRDVLGQITMQGKTSKSPLVSGFKAFIDTLVGILFKGSTKSAQARAVNGMTLLIKNVAGLMNVANQERLMSGELNLSQAIKAFTTQDIHNALNGDGLSTEFDNKLSSLLGDIVHKLHGPFGAFKADVLQRTSAAGSPEAVWDKAMDTGVAPLALSVRASPILATQKELHAMEQVEATVRAALDSGDASVRVAYKELDALFAEMRAKIKPTDFKRAGEWEFIFKVETKASGRSDHLARFAAFALAHQEFNRLMQQATKVDTRRVADARTIGERVQRVFEKILAFFAEKMTHTYAGQRADRKLEALVGQLVDIEAKKKLAIAKAAQPGSINPLATAEKLSESVVEMGKDAVLKAANLDFIKNSKNVFLRFGARMVRMHANDQVEYFIKEIANFRDAHFPGLHGLPTDILTQVKGSGQLLNMLQLMSTNSQRQRKHIITQTGKAVVAAFGQKLDKAAKAVITQVFMRTGLHSLLSQFNMLEIEQLMSDRKKLEQAITAVEAEFRDTAELRPFMEHFIIQANALAHFRVTGKVKHEKLMMNAHNISRLFGTGYTAKLTVEQSKIAEPIIERLVALYALTYVAPAELKQAQEILAAENAREGGQGNGVEFVLRLQAKLTEQAADRLFRGQQALMMHGYTPEIYNPGTAVTAANEEDGQELINQGYTKGEKMVSRDPANPDQEEKFLYILKDGGLARFQTGVVALTGKRAKGSPLHSGFLNVNTADGLENASLNADIAAAKPGGLSRGQRPDLSKTEKTFMAPVVNPQGEVVNWRYMMNDATKDALLERDNRFDNIMGVLAGSIFDKQSSAEVNGKAFSALKDMYQEERHSKAASYVLVGPKSTDAKLREIWSMLPDDAKNQARANFGRDGLYVRKDMLMPVFGYRTYSLSEAFKKDPDARTTAEKFLVDFVEWLLTTHAQVKARTQGVALDYQDARKMARKAAVLMARGEKGWQELVHEVKDIIVVKSIKVLVDNVLSNWSQLLIAGVSIKDILGHHLTALRGARAYERDQEALDQLQIQVAAGAGPKDAEQEIARLKDALARNPVRDLIEAGLMPTIVEDVAADDESDLYSYKSQLARKVAGFTDKLNPTVVDVAKTIYMAHDTKIYQGLSRVTRLSDFVARYTLYQHLTNQKGKGGETMSKEEALFEASESFVNYDSPLPKGLQYLDTMGIVPFLKYFLRIQRVLMRLVRKNPARVIGTLLLNNFVDLGPIVLESSWISKIGNNPLQWGALQLPGTIDDLGTIAAATAVVK